MSDFESVPVGTTAELERVNQERTKLAVHVWRLKEAGKAIRHELAQWALTEQDPETSAAMRQFDQFARETPATILSTTKRRWQAEALESLASDCACNRDVYERCMACAADLRIQQQGDEVENNG